MTRTVVAGELEKGDVVGGWLVTEFDPELVKRVSLRLELRTVWPVKVRYLVVYKSCTIPELLARREML